MARRVAHVDLVLRERDAARIGDAQRVVQRVARLRDADRSSIAIAGWPTRTLKTRNRPRPHTITLAAGGRGTCRFFNVRVGHPAIAIDKSGPTIAQAGDTLHYTLRVTNPGSVPFPQDQVDVSDPACHSAPKLSDKSDGSGSTARPARSIQATSGPTRARARPPIPGRTAS